VTWLEIVQQACRELGLVQPESVETATDLGTVQLAALVNREGEELRKLDWTELMAQFIITASVPVETTGTYATGATVITGIPDTTGLEAQYFVVQGSYINQDARIVSVDSPTQITINIPTSGAATAGDITFVRDTFQQPADFDRYINETWWDETNHWRLLGPDSPQLDQQHRSGIVTTGPRRHFRRVGRSPVNYRLWPPISAFEEDFSITFQYISKNWVLKADGTYASTMTDDDDESTLDGQAVVLGLKWRWMQIKSLDYAPAQQEYLDYVARQMANDRGAKTLRLDKTYGESFLLTTQSVPDGFWPGGD
jgi:hypothetical protein